MLSIKRVFRETSNGREVTLEIGDSDGAKGGKSLGNLPLSEAMLQTLLRKSRETSKPRPKERH